jgi:two-component system, OmpR family, alkaline phosphatase synthesis response regulator PhoP
MKILVAEDDRLTREGLVEVLTNEGYTVVAVSDGHEAIREFRVEQPDFVCLDIMMPRQSGFEACSAIRAEAPHVPIIFLSAKAEERDRLVGFELGADDFIVKPFSIREVIARVRAVARRCNISQVDGPSEFGDLTVSPSQLRAWRGDELIELSLRDVRIVQLLHQHRGEALDRNFIFRHAWGEAYFPNSRTLDQHISQLRKRIELDAKIPRMVLTVHGVGYRYDG